MSKVAKKDLTDKYLETQVRELKAMLKKCNFTFYKSISEPGRTSRMVSRLWPIIPKSRSLTQEQRPVWRDMLGREEALLTFNNKLLTYDKQNKRSLGAKDAVIKIKFVGDENCYKFYSWDFDYQYASLHIGRAKNSREPLQAFLAEFVTKKVGVWELEEFSMLGALKHPNSLNENTGFFFCFNKNLELFHIEERTLDFNPIYHDYYVKGVEDGGMEYGGVALLSVEEMELYRAQIAPTESDAIEDDAATDDAEENESHLALFADSLGRIHLSFTNLIEGDDAEDETGVMLDSLRKIVGECDERRTHPVVFADSTGRTYLASNPLN